MSKRTSVVITYKTDDSPRCTEDSPCIRMYNTGFYENGEVKVESGGSIIFFNGFGKGVPSTVKFYADLNAKQVGSPISGFCQGVTGTEFVVENVKFCNVTKPAASYRYSVEAAGYKKLDPVIIIEDPPVIPFIIVVLTIALLVGTGLGWLLRYFTK